MPKIIATKEDWIILGFKQFSQSGISGIVIERMATRLKVNKSSFYWHFSTKKAFIQEIVNYWERDSTSQIIEQVNQKQNPIDRFEKLIELSFRKDSDFDFFFYIKKYAKSNKELADKIEDLDKQRLNFTEEILQQIGFSGPEAKIKASLFYKYLIGHHEMIRYKKQRPDYMSEVKKELRQFIKF